MKGKITQVYAGLFAVFVFIFLGVKYNYLGTLPLWAVVLEILFMAVVLAVLMYLLSEYFLYAHTVRTKVCLPHQDVLLSVRLLRQFL